LNFFFRTGRTVGIAGPGGKQERQKQACTRGAVKTKQGKMQWQIKVDKEKEEEGKQKYKKRERKKKEKKTNEMEG